LTVKCPICPHVCESYETLFVHLMRVHRKNDVVAALLKLLESLEAAKNVPVTC